MNRREFLKLVGLLGAGTVVFGGCSALEAPKKDSLVGPVYLADEPATGTSEWYASTCQACSSGCGIIVRLFEGRAKKIEGNPIHPINQGKLCARGQAVLQTLYNPDRLRGPLKSVKSRGSRQYASTTWDEALATIAKRLSAIQAQGSPDRVLFLTGSLSGNQALVVNNFVKAFGAAGYVANEVFSQDTYYAANRLVFGQEILPDYDFENANYVLSFGANYIESWLSPVRFGRGFGALRQGRSGRRGKIVQFEPRLSLTAARADEWIPVVPGTEGVVALGIANVILAENLAAGAAGRVSAGWRTDIAAYTPDRVAQMTGINQDTIRRVAKEFAAAQPGFAIGGASVLSQTNGLQSLVAINVLNSIVGSIGVKGGVNVANPKMPATFPSRVPTAYSSLNGAIDRLNAGAVDTVFILGTNPVFTSPSSLRVADALGRAGLIVSFSSFLDETTSLADFILPASTTLESWGDAVPDFGAGNAIYETIQPVVSTMFDTRQPVDVLLSLAHSVGGKVGAAFPWKSSLEVMKDLAQQFQKANRGSVRDSNSDLFWFKLIQQGGWWSSGPSATGPAASAPAPAPAPSLRIPDSKFEGPAASYPFYLHVYETVALGEGRGANLPWMQEMPDPMTTAVWSSWVEVNPDTASRLGLSDGDPVWVESPAGRILLPLIVFPGARPDVVSVPVGQGHSAYGQYARDRGANPLSILASLTDTQTGTLALGATRVRLVKSTQPARLVRIEKVFAEFPNKAFFE